jgi:hypothetical protein
VTDLAIGSSDWLGVMFQDVVRTVRLSMPVGA